MCGCASVAEIKAAAEAVEVPETPPQLTIKPELLIIQPLTDRPAVKTNGDLEEWAEITDDDAKRDRRQLELLVTAEEQREHNQAEINAKYEEKKTKAKDAVEKINEVSNKARGSWWKKFNPF